MTDRKQYAWILLLVLGLLTAACGGGGDDATADSNPSPTTSPSNEASDQPGTTAPADEPADKPADEPGSSSDGNKGVVTIGDQTYEFDADASIVGRCEPDFFGAFWFIGTGPDGTGLGMLIIPEEAVNHSETSTITVNLKDSEDRNWRADEDGGEGATAGEGSVTSFTVDGNTVSGTASFVDTYGPDGATAEGTFTATCSG